MRLTDVVNKKWILRIGALCMAIVCLFYIFSFVQDQFFPESPTPAAPQSLASLSKPVLPASTAPSTALVDNKAVTGSPPADVPAIQTAGNLGKLTELRGKLEERKLEVELRGMEEKLAPKLPELASAPPLPVEFKRPVSFKPQDPSPVVVSVQGLDSKLSATVRQGGKLVSLRAGDHFQGGIISVVSRNEVLIRQGSSITALEFE
ncbi:MAG: hypothetical protein HQK81_15315 [Desulfovibrionaceae bacterium]|nr:hypothetical protein [Desulfovibrionaceae bacterium]